MRRRLGEPAQLGSRSAARAAASASIGSGLSRGTSRRTGARHQVGGYRDYRVSRGHQILLQTPRYVPAVFDGHSMFVPNLLRAHRIASRCPLLLVVDTFSAILRPESSMATNV